jgi:hypothetical protein
LLLRSLIDSVLGTHDGKAAIEGGWDGKASRVSYYKYPTLPNTLLAMLESGLATMATTTTTVGAESVFPALDFIRRAGPPDELRDELYLHIVKYLRNPAWHVREIAARTLCSCLLDEQWLQALEKIIHDSEKAAAAQRTNTVHGAFRTLKFVVEKLSDVMPDRLARKLHRSI